jgi:hypothetical protein
MIGVVGSGQMSVEASVMERPVRTPQAPVPVVRILADPAVVRIAWLAAALAALATVVAVLL